MRMLVEDIKAAARGEYRVAKGARGRIYARYGEGPVETKIGAKPVLRTELKVMRANGRIENYLVGANGELIPVRPPKFPKVRNVLRTSGKFVICAYRSLKARVGL
jgi:hypothetical protein